jgi:hypothetical protein
MIKNLLITGGCGFIGSNFINYYFNKHKDINIINLDAMYYCANEDNILEEIRKSDKYHLIKGNLCSIDLLNHILTILSNFINNQNLTDAHTCYKVFHRKAFDKINLQEKGFAFCPEVTTKLSLLGIDIKEVSINYCGRTFKEGKKISYLDGILAIFSLVKYKYFK